MKIDKTVSVIGLGYVGLPLALVISQKYKNVFGIDLDKRKNKLINNSQDPLNDEYVKSKIKNANLVATNDFSHIKISEIVIVCVPTPIKDSFEPDLTIFKDVVENLAKHLAGNTLVIIESTINPGVCDEIVIPMIEKTSKMKINQGFFVAHCPERINPGDSKWNLENIPRVVGASNRNGLKMAYDFYDSIMEGKITKMGTIKEAEAVKVVENSFRDVNIAFVNELAMSFTKLGINVKNVINGASTKPFAFMPHYPSIGVGGHCIPVDPYYLIEYAKGYGFDHEFLSLARSINNRMPEFTVDQLLSGLNEIGKSLKGAKILLLGLAYKPNVSDDRESPSYKVVKILEDRGAKVDTYDPYLIDKSSVKTIKKGLEDKDAVILATNHTDFDEINFTGTGIKVFVDGKNCMDSSKFKNKGIVYKGIGV